MFNEPIFANFSFSSGLSRFGVFHGPCASRTRDVPKKKMQKHQRDYTLINKYTTTNRYIYIYIYTYTGSSLQKLSKLDLPYKPMTHHRCSSHDRLDVPKFIPPFHRNEINTIIPMCSKKPLLKGLGLFLFF